MQIGAVAARVSVVGFPGPDVPYPSVGRDSLGRNLTLAQIGGFFARDGVAPFPNLNCASSL